GGEARQRRPGARLRPARGRLRAARKDAGSGGPEGRTRLPFAGHGADGARDQPRRPRTFPRPRRGLYSQRHRPLNRPAGLLADGGSRPRQRLRAGDAGAAPRRGPGGLPRNSARLGRPGQPRLRRPQHRSRRRDSDRGRGLELNPFLPGREPRRSGIGGARRRL
ncbi:MAG: hypothetical protein AVDCRST_MAG01-01-3070, partial [uncultured Rubrobacteraceae bacterium]